MVGVLACAHATVRVAASRGLAWPGPGRGAAAGRGGVLSLYAARRAAAPAFAGPASASGRNPGCMLRLPRGPRAPVQPASAPGRILQLPALHDAGRAGAAPELAVDHHAARCSLKFDRRRE